MPRLPVQRTTTGPGRIPSPKGIQTDAAYELDRLDWWARLDKEQACHVDAHWREDKIILGSLGPVEGPDGLDLLCDRLLEILLWLLYFLGCHCFGPLLIEQRLRLHSVEKLDVLFAGSGLRVSRDSRHLEGVALVAEGCSPPRTAS